MEQSHNTISTECNLKQPAEYRLFNPVGGRCVAGDGRNVVTTYACAVISHCSTVQNYTFGSNLRRLNRARNVLTGWAPDTVCFIPTDGSSEQPQLPTPLAGRIPWVSTQQDGPAAHYVRHRYNTRSWVRCHV